jgi:hypothetical protein
VATTVLGQATSAANAWDRQNAAMLELFKSAFKCQQGDETTATRDEIEKAHYDRLVMADAVRFEAHMVLARQGTGNDLSYFGRTIRYRSPAAVEHYQKIEITPVRTPAERRR